MQPSRIVFKKEIPNRDKFGEYVKWRRAELNMSVRDLAKALDLTPAYISDIEKGNRMAPQNHLEQMIEILQVEENEIEFFYDLAGCSHSNWPEINEYLAKTPNARKAIRLARDNGLSEEEFLSMVENLNKNEDQEISI